MLAAGREVVAAGDSERRVQPAVDECLQPASELCLRVVMRLMGLRLHLPTRLHPQLVAAVGTEGPVRPPLAAVSAPPRPSLPLLSLHLLGFPPAAVPAPPRASLPLLSLHLLGFPPAAVPAPPGAFPCSVRCADWPSPCRSPCTSWGFPPCCLRCVNWASPCRSRCTFCSFPVPWAMRANCVFQQSHCSFCGARRGGLGEVW